MSDYVVLMIAYIRPSLIGSYIALYSVPCNIDWEEFQAVFVLTFAVWWLADRSVRRATWQASLSSNAVTFQTLSYSTYIFLKKR